MGDLASGCKYFRPVLPDEYPHETCVFYGETSRCLHVESEYFGEKCPKDGKK